MPLFDSASAALDVSIRNSWNGGLVADLAFMPEDAVSGWTVEFEYAGTIVNIWNARIVSRTGDRYVVENLGYNSTVNAGGTAGFGFVGSGASDGITALAINGEPVGGSDPEPAPLPMVSIGDAVAAEEDGSIGFQLTLSEPSDTDVTVSYQIVAGTALAGSDFAVGNAQVVIPAGQISAVLSVALADDAAPEATEQFQVQLTGATGAEIADGEATGQITDSDVAPAPVPDPVVSLGDASVQEGDPDGGGTGNIATGLIVDGPLSTSGNQILDANGDAVQIRAVNWFGAENDVRAPHGLWQRPMTEMMDQMVEEGFNAIRLPFSVQNILEDLPATSVAGDPSLAGLTTLEIFDRIVDYAEEIGIKIILDAHRITQGNGAEGIWYAGQYDEADWIEAWELLANRYGDSDAVIGADLLNEPHLGTWGTGQRNDWAAAAEQAGNAVLEIAPDWLIVVEGIGNYQGNNYWWGGQLQGVRDRPVVLNADDKLVYSPHDYPASIFNQPWFNDGSNLYDVFRENWGFIFEEEIAPVLLGEFGSRLENPADLPWAEAIIDYLGGDFDGDGMTDLQPGQTGPSFAWWSWNPNSGDTGGYVLDDWTTVRQNAADLLAPLLDDAAGEGAPGGDPASNPVYLTFDVMLDAPAAEAVSYTYETRDGTALAGSDYVAATGTVAFAAGQQVAEIQVEVLPDTDPEGDETFALVLNDLDGTEISATGTILNDDAAAPDPDPVDPDPVDPDPVDPDPVDPDPVDPDPVDPDPVDPDPVDPDPVDPDPVDPPDDGGDQGGDAPSDGIHTLSLDDWGAGFVARFSFTPDSAVSGGWTARIATTATITNIWNAEIVSQEDGVLTIRNASWNASIPAGQTIEVGFQGSGSSAGLGLIDSTLGVGGGADVPDDPDPVDPGDDGGMGDDAGMGGGTGNDDTGNDGEPGGSTGGSGPFVGGGQTYFVGQTSVVTGFDPTRDVLDLGPNSIHNQIPVDTPDGLMFLHMFNASQSLLLEGVHLADLHPENFAPISDSHLQQDLSAALAYEDGTGLVRPNTVYVRSHEEGVEEIVDFNPATDKVSFFYLSVRGDGGLNFTVEETAEGARFYSPLTGQSTILRGVSFSDLDSSHFEWRANQLEDGIAGRMGLASVIDGFTYPSENVFSGKSVAMAGLVDRAPYHTQQDYTGTPIGAGTDPAAPTGDDDGAAAAPVVVTVTGGSVTEADPGVEHVHDDGSTHIHDDGHRFITFQVALDAPVIEAFTLTYSTADGTALADTSSSVAYDYHEAAGNLVFQPGEQIKTVVVSIHPDILVEETETFSLSVVGDNITGDLAATGTILDNDVADPQDDGMGGHDMGDGMGDGMADGGHGDGMGDGGMGDMPDEPDDPDGHTGHDGHAGHGDPASGFTDITEYGVHHGTSSHTHHDSLEGGRTAITTEAMLAYNGLRDFLGLEDATIEEVGTWAFDNGLTNNTQAWGGDLQGVGLWYAMQGAKVGWIRDDAFDPQILADIQREARLGDPAEVMSMVEDFGHDGFGAYLMETGLSAHFVETMKMEPHYGGWMHGRTHGYLNFPEGGAIAHDVNHLTVLSHDQMQPFMNDTFDWPQWPALNVPHQDVIDYFQSMVVLGDPLGDALPSDGSAPAPVDPPVEMPVDPVEPPDPVDPDPADSAPTAPGDDGSAALDASLRVVNDWGSGAVIELDITNTSQSQVSGGWQVQFGFDTDQITGSWNSSWSASAGGSEIVVSDVGWNSSLNAGQTVSVGFQINQGGLDEDRLNDEAAFLFV